MPFVFQYYFYQIENVVMISKWEHFQPDEKDEKVKKRESMFGTQPYDVAAWKHTGVVVQRYKPKRARGEDCHGTKAG